MIVVASESTAERVSCQQNLWHIGNESVWMIVVANELSESQTRWSSLTRATVSQS